MNAANENLKKNAEKEIKLYLKWITEKEDLLKTETDLKKADRIKKDIETWHKRSIIKSAARIGQAQQNLHDIYNEITEREQDILCEILPPHLEWKQLSAAEKRYNTINIIKRRVDKIIKLSKNHSYSDELPIEKKLKNKLYNKEQQLGMCLKNESDPNGLYYNEAWNFEKDLKKTEEFTEEEKEIIIKSIKNAEEKIAYVIAGCEEIANLGLKLENSITKSAESSNTLTDTVSYSQDIKNKKQSKTFLSFNINKRMEYKKNIFKRSANAAKEAAITEAADIEVKDKKRDVRTNINIKFNIKKRAKYKKSILNKNKKNKNN